MDLCPMTLSLILPGQDQPDIVDRCTKHSGHVDGGSPFHEGESGYAWLQTDTSQAGR